MLRNSTILIVWFLAAVCLGRAQDQSLPQSSIAINLPADAPVALVSSESGESRASARGGAMLLDLHMSLKLRNNSAHRIHGLTMIVSAQEVTPGGKGSWAAWLDVGAGVDNCPRSCHRADQPRRAPSPRPIPFLIT